MGPYNGVVHPVTRIPHTPIAHLLLIIGKYLVGISINYKWMAVSNPLSPDRFLWGTSFDAREVELGHSARFHAAFFMGK